MIYPMYLTVPKSTPAEAPVSVRYWIAPGTITRWLYVMPNGCYDRVWLRLLSEETQILPTLAEGWLKGNGVMGPFEENIIVPPGGLHVQLQACSPSTTYAHDIYAILNVVRLGATMDDLVAAIRGEAPDALSEDMQALIAGESNIIQELPLEE